MWLLPSGAAAPSSVAVAVAVAVAAACLAREELRSLSAIDARWASTSTPVSMNRRTSGTATAAAASPPPAR